MQPADGTTPNVTMSNDSKQSMKFDKTMTDLSKNFTKQKKELCIESKSVVLIESIDKLANLCLAEDSLILPQEESSNTNKQAKNKMKVNTIKCIIQESLSKAIKIQQNRIEENYDKELLITSRSSKLAKKYFNIWRKKVKKKKRPDTALIKKEKIDNFVERLKQCKEKLKQKPEINKNDKLECYRPKPPKKESETFKNRLKAQQTLIDNQKTQINEQKRMIENLRLGIIQEETVKSLDNSRNQLREIFRRCSGRVRCKITPPEAVENDVDVIELRCSKPPKILVEMEKRAEERMLKRQIILERKKVLDERKKQEVAKALANKRTADEEERKRNLEAIKEKRRQEAEALRLKDLRRKEYLESIRKAEKFYNKRVKAKVFNGFKKMIEIRDENYFKSEIFYDTCLQKCCFIKWRNYTLQKNNERNNKADRLLKLRILAKYFKSWARLLVMQRQSMQVAEDIYDMKLQSKMFLYWQRYYNWEQMISYKKMEIARKHFERKILVQYFYLWKSLPAVIQLEKAKEEKKRKWREKVWEIIPDYNPYGEESIVII